VVVKIAVEMDAMANAVVEAVPIWLMQDKAALALVLAAAQEIALAVDITLIRIVRS
jgi:hypothetical protein